MGMTKVGPPNDGDRYRKKGLLARIVNRLFFWTGVMSFMRVAWFVPTRRMDKVMDLMLAEDPAELDAGGLPEADLSVEDRRAAMERMQRDAEQAESERKGRAGR